jgi:hypothetical protein
MTPSGSALEARVVHERLEAPTIRSMRQHLIALVVLNTITALVAVAHLFVHLVLGWEVGAWHDVLSTSLILASLAAASAFFWRYAAPATLQPRRPLGPARGES